MLIVWGARDPIIPVAARRRGAQALPGSRLEIFEGAATCPSSSSPRRFIAVLERFLAETEPAQFDRDEWLARFKSRLTHSPRRARQDSNLWPLPPEGSALSS